MSDKKSPYFKGAMWIGLVFSLAGGAIIIQSIKVGTAYATTPRWVGIAFGLMFFNAGISVGLLDSVFNRYRENYWFCYLHAIALLSIPLIFPLLFNWVAFGLESVNLASAFLSLS